MWRVLSNYGTVWTQGDYLRGLMNSLLVVVPTAIGVIVLGSFAAWVVARAKARFTRALQYVAIFGLLVPPSIVMVIIVFRWFHIYGNLVGLDLFYLGTFLSFAVFFMIGFVKTIPIELEEAAQIDGAGRVFMFFRIIFPLLRPVMMTTLIILLISVWNDFFYPFMLLSSSANFTLVLGLFSFVSSHQNETAWNLEFADVVFTTLPLIVVFIFAQKRIMAGLMRGIR